MLSTYIALRAEVLFLSRNTRINDHADMVSKAVGVETALQFNKFPGSLAQQKLRSKPERY